MISVRMMKSVSLVDVVAPPTRVIPSRVLTLVEVIAPPMCVSSLKMLSSDLARGYCCTAEVIVVFEIIVFVLLMCCGEH